MEMAVRTKAGKRKRYQNRDDLSLVFACTLFLGNLLPAFSSLLDRLQIAAATFAIH
jgi:hypothetical protein